MITICISIVKFVNATLNPYNAGSADAGWQLNMAKAEGMGLELGDLKSEVQHLNLR